ncbi:YfiR family protein [Luteitalea sp.]
MPRQRRGPLGCVRCAAVVLLLAGATDSFGQTTDEPRLKAAFLSRFPGFVDWPASSWSRAPLVLCVAAPGAVFQHLQDLTHGTHLRGKPLAARVLAPEDDPARCHVLFLPGEATGRQRLLARAALLPVLTVGDDPDFLDQGGIIALHAAGPRLRFAIDAAAAQRVGLRLNSQLLGLAVEVRGLAR